MLLRLLGGARVVIYFRNDDQMLLVRSDSSGWFSLSVVPISYVVGVGCLSLLFLGIELDCFSKFSECVASCNFECKIHAFLFELYALCRMACCSYLVLILLSCFRMVLPTNRARE